MIFGKFKEKNLHWIDIVCYGQTDVSADEWEKRSYDVVQICVLLSQLQNVNDNTLDRLWSSREKTDIVQKLFDSVAQ